MKRKLLGRASRVATRQRVYSVADGLEIDEVDHYEVRRSRVLYDDVVLVTHHRYRGVWPFVFMALFAGLLGWMSWLLYKEAPPMGEVAAATTVLPLVLLMILRALLGVDEINVYGRRTRARLRFLFRKSYGRKLLGEITSAVRRRQEAIARRAPEEPPEPPGPEISTESLPVM